MSCTVAKKLRNQVARVEQQKIGGLEEMTVKEFAALAGVSHQAIYKKLKGRGVALDKLKDKETGQLTAEGETLLRSIFHIQEQGDEQRETGVEEAVEVERGTAPPAPETNTNELRNQVEKLTAEVEKLRNQVATLEEKEKTLTEERDFLRVSLERSQQLQAITAAKIPNPAPALPAGREPHGLRAWWRNLRTGRKQEE